jgi:coenzyme F420-reducing hydrogenase beta subunit
MGFDIEQVRTHIQSICGGAAAIGATALRAEGLRFELVDGVVVTVTPDRQHPSKINRARNSQKMAEAYNGPY